MRQSLVCLEYGQQLAYEPVQLARKNEMFVAVKMTPNNLKRKLLGLMKYLTSSLTR